MTLADLWELAISLAKQGLAAAAFAVLGFLYARLRQRRRMRHFRRVFGRGVEKAEDIVLSVPLWYARSEDRKQLRFDKKRGDTVEESLFGPTQMYNRQDMFAAAHVLNVLNSHLDKEVTYSNDAETPSWDQKSLILIGSPAANLHMRDYMLKHRPDAETAAYPHFVLQEETPANRARVHLRDPERGKAYHASEQVDYGLVLRLPNAYSEGSSHCVFMVGGIHEWSTREAGRLFNLHWRELGRRTFGQSCMRLLTPWRWKETPAPSGFIFEMNSEEKGLGTARKVCVF